VDRHEEVRILEVGGWVRPPSNSKYAIDRVTEDRHRRQRRLWTMQQ